MSGSASSVKIAVDTDMGVDDAAALAFLLGAREPAVEVVGVSAVFGNTSVEDAAANALSLLDALGHDDVPVAVGAAAPRSRPRSLLGAFLHGGDGLWGFHHRRPLARCQRDLASFYRGVVKAHPGAVLLTLGPLTNVARIAAEAPEVLRGFSRIVTLGGAKNAGGSITPVAEANFWHDPESAAEVLSLGLPVTLVLRDAHVAFSLEPADIESLCAAPTAAGRFLAGPLARYSSMAGSLGAASTGLPDVVAAVYAAVPSIGLDVRPARVKVLTTGDPLARGQSVIGIHPSERISMTERFDDLEEMMRRAVRDGDYDLRAPLRSILARAADDATVVTKVDAARVRALFLGALGG